jgi:hypothetical protein
LVDGSSTLTVWENNAINGMLQTADYARHIFESYAALQTRPGTRRTPSERG